MTSTTAPDVVLYTRDGCHLCDEARATLRDHGLMPREVDVDRHKALGDRFGDCVPVIEVDGKVRFRGRVDPLLLRRFLVYIRGTRT
jgi:glutaredoxin